MDWTGHRFITRNEGVPGSSPGVGFERGPRILRFLTGSASIPAGTWRVQLSLERSPTTLTVGRRFREGQGRRH
jgi:hypothetical protein